MNTNYMDLLDPIIQRYNKDVAEFSKFLEEQLGPDHFYGAVKNSYGAIERITIMPKTGNYKTIEVYVYMDGTVNIHYCSEQQLVEKEPQIPLWSPSDLTKVLEKMKTFFLGEVEVA